MVELEYVNCDICGEDDTELLFKIKDRAYGLPVEFRVNKCQNCDLVYLNPRLSKREMRRLYPEEHRPREPAITNKMLRFIWHSYLRLFAGADLWSLEDFPKGKVLDVGCGSGRYLKTLKDEGYETHGVEISSLAVEHAKKLGLNVFTGELREAKFPDKHFDLIIFRQSLEHMHSPSEALKEAHRILKDNRRLVIGVPNASSMEAKMFGKYWYNWDMPGHLYFFSPHTLTLLLEKCGFSITKIDYEVLPSPPRGIFVSLGYVFNIKIERRLDNHAIYKALLLGSIHPLGSIISKFAGGRMVARARKKASG